MPTLPKRRQQPSQLDTGADQREPNATEPVHDADRNWFRSLVPVDPRVQIKPMFGNVGAFVSGNMFLGLFGSDVGVRLAATDLEGLLAFGGGPFGPAGRPMGEYASLPTAWRGKPAKNTTWVAKALDHVGAGAHGTQRPQGSSTWAVTRPQRSRRGISCTGSLTPDS